MNDTLFEERLLSHGVKPTAMRLLVLRTLAEAEQTLTLRDLEERLYPAERSTLFRTLTLFQLHNLVHCIEDGSGSARYEACKGEHHGDDDDQHIHFHCTLCGRTFCLTDIPVPPLSLPEGFESMAVNCVVSGICPQCAKK